MATSNWKFIIPALLGFVYCIYLFQVAQRKTNQLAGEEVLMIDMRSNYSLNEINTFFTNIKSEGRQIHKHITGVTDMIFPIAYGILFILLSAFFLKKLAGPDSNWMYLSLVPVLLMILDYMENFNTLELLETYPDLTAEMVDNASNITGLKGILTNISMGLPLILGIVWLVKKFTNRSNTQ